MKRIYSKMMMLAIMVATLGFVSCSDDDDDPKVPSLVGTWQCTQVIPANNDLLDVESDFVLDDLLKFTSKEYTISGSFSDNGIWDLTGDDLTLRSAVTDEIIFYDLVQLTANSLVFKNDFVKYVFTKKQVQ